MRILCHSLALIASALLALVAHNVNAQGSACGTSGASLSGLQIDGLGLTFKKGAFLTESTVALDRGTATRFSIKSSKGLALSFHVKSGGNASPWISMEVENLQDIKGVLKEEIRGGACRREVIIDPRAFDGAKLKSVHAELPGVWGGVLHLQDGAGVLSHASLIEAKASGTVGSISAVISRGASIKGARVLFQENAPLVVTASGQGEITIELDLSRLTAKVQQGEFIASQVQMPGVRLRAGDLLLTGLRGTVGSFAISAGPSNTLTFGSIRGSAEALTYTVTSSFAGSGLTIKKIDRMAWEGLVFSGESVQASSKEGQVGGAEIACVTCSYSGSTGAVALAGPAMLSVQSLTSDTINASSTWSSPSISGLPSLHLLATVKQLTASLSGQKDAPTLTGHYELSILRIGRLNIDGILAGSWIWSDREMLAHTSTRLSKNKIQLGLPPTEIVNGTAPNGEVRADLRLTAGAISSVTIPPNGLGITFTPMQARLAVLGGNLSLPLEPCVLANDDNVVVGPQGVSGTAIIGVSKLTLTDVKMQTSGDQALMSIQKAPSVVQKPHLRLSMKAQSDPSPSFLLQASVDLPGFDLRPPGGINSVNVELSGYEIAVSRVAADGFRIVWLDDKVTVSMLGFIIGAISIHTPVDTQGHPRRLPVLEGHFTTSPTIGETFYEVELWPEPLKTVDMGLRQFAFGLDHVRFASPGVADVSNGTLTFNAKLLTPSQIDAAATVTAGDLSWDDALSGKATLRSLDVKLSGEREKPNGSVTVDVPEVTLKGKSEIQIGNNNDAAVIGCGVTIVSNTSGAVHNVQGTIQINAGLPDGYLTAASVDDIVIDYGGRKECIWDWRPRFDWSFKYPCIGTIDDPFRECEAKDSKEFRIPLTFTVHDVHLGGEITEVRYHVISEKNDEGKDSTKFKRCNARLNRLYQTWIPPFYASIDPDWTDVPDWLRGIAQTAYDALTAPFFITLTNVPLDLAAVATFAGYPLRKDENC
ncbi:hypothetical protein [Caballeronia sp. GaOx3]|uniref:hypothetical protein n=1 Tax=Caballeronia sp. GaOx3 TaxID=2921740 RepID=UPI002029254D|nr:hypothetical protein [Caballeronia sp. GaOx3]